MALVPVQQSRKAQVRAAVVQQGHHLQRGATVRSAPEGARRDDAGPAARAFLQQFGLIEGLVHLPDGQPPVGQHLCKAQRPLRDLFFCIKEDADLRHIAQREEPQPLGVDLGAVQLEGQVRLPFFQAAPQLTAGGTAVQHGRIGQAQLPRQGQQIVAEHPHGVVVVGDLQMQDSAVG